MNIFKKIRNNRIFQVVGFSWLVCLISHVIIPVFVVFPIFDRFISTEDGELGFVAEMLIFTVLIIPVSLIVSFIHSRIKKKEHCCDHSEPDIACENCPHKDDAITYVQKLHEAAAGNAKLPNEKITQT